MLWFHGTAFIKDEIRLVHIMFEAYFEMPEGSLKLSCRYSTLQKCFQQ